MGGGSWKVAYADFVTAMMAFFLLMWILNMAPKETLKGLADFFSADASGQSNVTDPLNDLKKMLQYRDKMDTRETVDMKDIEQSHYAIAQLIKQLQQKDAIPQTTSGITANQSGVLMHITSSLMFVPGTTTFTDAGRKALQEVIDVMNKYNVYLVVRGHADSSESGAPNYPSNWELSAARANAAVEYLISKGIAPTKVRSMAYADTQPLVPPTVSGAAQQNSRVDFNFHRPEVMSTVTSF